MNSRVVQGLIYAASLLAACSDATDPSKQRATLAISSVTSNYLVSADSTGWPNARCDVTLKVKATGKGSATISSAKDRWYWGLNRAVAVDSSAFDGQVLVEDWSAAIQAGDSLESYWYFYGPFPFELELAFAYGLPGEGAPDTATTRLACGSKPPGPPPPQTTITRLDVTHSPGVLQPGQSLSVSYDANNAGTVWATYAWAIGAFTWTKSFAEGKVSATQTVQAPIPVGSTLGIPSTVGVWAYDQFARKVALTTNVEPLVDVTPPTLDLLQFHGFDNPYKLGGVFFVNDSVRYRVLAQDNHQVASVVWSASPSGPKDSIVVGSLQYAGDRSIVFGSEWLSTDGISFVARDASGNSKTLTLPPGFRVVPTVQRPSWSTTIGGNTIDYAIDTLRDMVYIAQSSPQRVQFLSMATQAVTRTIAVRVAGLDMVPGSNTLVLASGDSLTTIDLTQSPPVVSKVALNVNTALHQTSTGVRVAANGRAFLRMQGDSASAYRLLDLNLANGQQIVRSDGAGGGVAGNISRSHDHSTLAVARSGCTQRYDSGTDAFGACGVIIPTDVRLHVDGTGSHFVMGVKVYDSNLTFVRSVQSSADLSNSTPSAFTIDPAGEYVYHYLGGTGILKSRVSDGALIERFLWSAFVPTDMRVSPDGKRLILISDGASSPARVGVVDLTTTLP